MPRTGRLGANAPASGESHLDAVIKPNSIVSVGIDLPVDEAVHTAADNLMEWMQEEYGIKPQDSYMRFSADPDFRIRVYQMVRANIRHVVGAEYPRSRLKPAF